MERVLHVKNRNEFLKYLDSVSKINDSAIFEIKPEGITSLVSSADNTLVLLSEFVTASDFTSTINVPDIKKLYRVLETINEEEIELKINGNNLEYKGKGLKFKYHLFEEGFLSKPNLNVEKIRNFTFDVKFNITKAILQQLFKGSTFASETNKVYIYTEDGDLKAELTDRARHNTDNFTVTIGSADFELSPIPINFDNIRLMSSIDSEYVFNVNTQHGVVVVDNNSDSTKLKYIISSLTQ